MKTWTTVLAVALVLIVAIRAGYRATLAVSSRSCRESEVPSSYYRVRFVQHGQTLSHLPASSDAAALRQPLVDRRAAGLKAWLEVSCDSGRTWEQATDDGVQTTFTVEKRP